MTRQTTQPPASDLAAPAIPRNTILSGDALNVLRTLPDGQVDCVVTSPPYYRLRDYGHDSQLGLESSIDDYLGSLMDIAAQIGRVLTPTGTYWLNLGDTYSTHPRDGAPQKSLIGVPERVLLAHLNRGWIVRNKIVWAKTNPIPTSVTDRLATTYEVIYVLTRQPRYFFDLDAIRQPHRTQGRTTTRRRRSDNTRRPPARRDPHRPNWKGPNANGTASGAGGDSGLTRLRDSGNPGHPLGKNPGDVWHLATSRYRGAHFATYPEQLAQRMIAAGCPEARCTICRQAWRRPVRRLGATAVRLALTPTCDCAAPSEPGLVLDPFLGSGTTAVAAEALGRDWLGIELNPDYIALADSRIREARTTRTASTTATTTPTTAEPRAGPARASPHSTAKGQPADTRQGVNREQPPKRKKPTSPKGGTP